MSWTRQPVATRDTGWVVKEEIVSGMRPNTDYIITVTVVTDSYNITSNTSVQYGDIRSMSEFLKNSVFHCLQVLMLLCLL